VVSHGVLIGPFLAALNDSIETLNPSAEVRIDISALISFGTSLANLNLLAFAPTKADLR
jgi:hypothetical protein